MKKFSCLFAVVLLLCANRLIQAQDIPAHPNLLEFPELIFEPPAPESFRATLSNGMVVYIAEDRELPLINLSLLIRAGSAWEPAGKAGLASITGAMLRDGGTSTRTPEELDDEIDFLAASISTGIGGTSGSASLNVLSKDIEQGLSLLLDILRNPGFDEDRFRIQRERIRQNLSRRNDRTEDIESREWQYLLYGEDHFSARNLTSESLNAITRDDLFAYHRQFIHPGNMMIVVAGDFERSQMLQILENAFSDWPAGTAWNEPVPVPAHEPAAGIYLFHKDDVNQGRVSMGHRTITHDNPDRFALQIMNGILGGSGLTSRITSRVRSDEGLAYDARSAFGVGLHYPGAFSASFQSRSEAVAYAAQIVLEEIERIRSVPVSNEELETELNFVLERFPQSFANAYQTVLLYARDEFAGRDPARFMEYRDNIRRVTGADVQRVAQQYLRPEEMVIVVVGDINDIERGDPAYDASLERLGAYPIHRFPLRDPLTLRFP